MRRSFRKVPIRSRQVANGAHLEIRKIEDGIPCKHKKAGPVDPAFSSKTHMRYFLNSFSYAWTPAV